MSRRIDVAIAESLGYEVRREGKDFELKKFDGGGYRWYALPYYSTDSNAMLELGREMLGRGWLLTVSHTSDNITPFMATYTHKNSPIEGQSVVADTEPLARALVAYKALTGREWEGA